MESSSSGSALIFWKLSHCPLTERSSIPHHHREMASWFLHEALLPADKTGMARTEACCLLPELGDFLSYSRNHTCKRVSSALAGRHSVYDYQQPGSKHRPSSTQLPIRHSGVQERFYQGMDQSSAAQAKIRTPTAVWLEELPFGLADISKVQSPLHLEDSSIRDNVRRFQLAMSHQTRCLQHTFCQCRTHR